MALNSPVVSWYNVDKVNPANSNRVQIAQPFDFGVVDAGYTPLPTDYYSFIIWNNRNNRIDDAPKMEDVSIGIKDLNGGNGSTVGQEVWAINGGITGTGVKWFHAKVDSLGQTDADFAQIGATLTKPIGAGLNKSTENPSVAVAVVWKASTSFNIGDVVKPTVDNGFVYKVKTAGLTGTVQPTWSTVEGESKVDNVVEFITVKSLKTTIANNEILGGVNRGNDSDWATKSTANFSIITLKCEVPLDARAGRQDFKLRSSYRYV